MSLKSVSFQRRYMDKKCTIYSTSTSKVKGSQIITKSVIHTLIDCNYWRASSMENYNDKGLSLETDKERFEVNLIADKLDVRKGMNVELFYGSNISIGEYIIDSVEYYENSGGPLDNIKLLVTKIL